MPLLKRNVCLISNLRKYGDHAILEIFDTEKPHHLHQIPQRYDDLHYRLTQRNNNRFNYKNLNVFIMTLPVCEKVTSKKLIIQTKNESLVFKIILKSNYIYLVSNVFPVALFILCEIMYFQAKCIETVINGTYPLHIFLIHHMNNLTGL